MSEVVRETQDFEDALEQAQERASKIGASVFDAMIDTYVEFGLIRELE